MAKAEYHLAGRMLEGDWYNARSYRYATSRGGRVWRFFWYMVVPPEGHRIVPTPAGYILLLVMLGFGTAAYSTSHNILFMALSLIVSSFILSGVLSMMNFKGTLWRMTLPPVFRVGEEAMMEIEVYNTKRILPTYSLSFKVQAETAKHQSKVHLEERLDPGERRLLNWRFHPVQRGREKLQISGLESQFPFGFLRKTVGGGIKREVLVLPRQIEYEFAPHTGRNMPRQGQAIHHYGVGSELINIRRYRQGDAQRQVHWKASARLRHLMVRQTAEESRESFVLFLEVSASQWRENAQFERLCCFASSLAEDLFRQGRLSAYAINGEPVRLVKRLHDLHALLERLALLKPVSDYRCTTEVKGVNVLTFRPGTQQQVNLFLADSQVGVA